MNKIKWLTILFILIEIFHLTTSAGLPVVTTPLGKIRGTFFTSRLGKPIYSFRGIKYAKPPINELRFKPPVPVDKWDDIYDAIQDGPSCPQITQDPVSEDCLIVNVYSPQLPNATSHVKRPVIVFIHQGGFYSAGSQSFNRGPQYFLDQDIVLVTFNYRLGALGFLCTGTKEAPGNYGMKDQVLLLKWVKANIASFGGDPNSVTIMGYSAGGRSVTLHMVSPMSKGLFHKGIQMSGSSVATAPIPYHEHLDVARRQARFVGCSDDTPQVIVECLRSKPANEIAQTLPQLLEFGFDPTLIFKPVIEADFGEPRFLTDHPIRLVVNGNFNPVPFMTGQNIIELGYKTFNVVNNETLTKEMNDEWERVAPISFQYERNTSFSRRVSRALKAFYLNGNLVDKSKTNDLAKIYTDSITAFGVNRAAKLFAQYCSQPVYYYKFSFQGRYSFFYLPGTNNTVPYGVVHHDELMYFFYFSLRFPFFNEQFPKEARMVSRLTSLWANFAKAGNPTPIFTEKLDNVKWIPFNLRDQKYLDIGDQLVVRERLFEKRFAEWENLFPICRYLENTNRTV